ncbi:MAG: phosphotransferase [Akkermansiaceae bacterium]
MEFHTIKLGARPLLAVPAGAKGMLQAAIACYPAHTIKKRVVRVLLQTLARVGLLKLIFPARGLPSRGVAGVDFESWINDLCIQLDAKDLHPVLVWPGDPERGRIYVHLLDSSGRAVAFAKIGLDAYNNELIERERETLERLSAMQLELSRVPKLLAHGELDTYTYMVVETLPTGARATDWVNDPSIDENIAEYAGDIRHLEEAEIRELPWWGRVKTALAERDSLMREVHAALSDGIDVCLAHGDLNCTNVLRNGNDVWLLDWEQSDANAPCLTDRVCVTVDKLWLANPQDSAGNLQKFKDLFPDHADAEIQGSLVMALGYLASANFPPAIAMVDAWYPNA